MIQIGLRPMSWRARRLGAALAVAAVVAIASGPGHPGRRRALSAGVFTIITLAESSSVVLIYHYLLGEACGRSVSRLTG